MSLTFRRTRGPGPLEMAHKQNQQLMLAYKARVAKLSNKNPNVTSMVSQGVTKYFINCSLELVPLRISRDGGLKIIKIIREGEFAISIYRQEVFHGIFNFTNKLARLNLKIPCKFVINICLDSHGLNPDLVED